MAEIVHALEPILLVGGGTIGLHDFETGLQHTSRVVAADGGCLPCLERGITPEAVIGDMDSLGDAVARGFPAERIHQVAEQDSTDFDKALRHIRAPLVIGIGFTGARIDHELAAYHTLAARADRRCLLLGEEEIVFLAPPALSLDLRAGTRVSLFPMADVSGTSQGLRWEIDGIHFAPHKKIGTSNEASGPVEMRFDAPAMLVILPRDCLNVAVSSLAAQSGSWSAL